MLCPTAGRRYSDLTASLMDAAIRERVPIMGALELTFGCNLACRHCYCNIGLHDGRRREELTTPEWRRVIDEMAAAGCLWVLLTGGETLARDDFKDIYLHALDRGMIIELFTNATLIDDATASFLADHPPFGIDISIYGATAAVHDHITRVPGSFDRALEGLACLRERGVGYSLKTILMTLNYDDLAGMKSLAARLGARFHFDALITPRLGGGMEPAQYRLDTARLVSLDIDDEEEFRNCETVFGRLRDHRPDAPNECASGIFAFNINPYGSLSPCTMFSSFNYSLREASFSDAWKRLVREYDAARGTFTPDECRSCSMAYICTQCPAWAEMETGNLRGRVAYLCDYGKEMERRFLEKRKEKSHGQRKEAAV